MSQYQRNKRELLKEKCLAYLGGKKCAKCSVASLPIVCYDFHHKNGLKEALISERILRNAPWQELKKELDKCLVVCANCHRILTSRLV
jgi:predicted FMN-binding regulatory protein PaiB